MKINYWVILFYLGFVAPLQAQESIFEKTIVVPVPESESYKTYKGILYKGNEGDKTLADIFVPKKKSEALPAIIFVHGGPVPDSVPLAPKDWGQYQSYGPLMTEMGFAGVVFNHRYNSLDNLLVASNNVQDTVKYIRNNSEKYSIDKDNICLWFFSGGGNFIAPFLRDRPEWLKCMVIYYGVLGSDVLKNMGADLSDGVQKKSDLIHFLSTKTDWDPAFFIAEAGKDNEALNAGLREFSHTALEHNWSVEYWNHPTGPHAFDVLIDDQRSRGIIRGTLDFLSTQLKIEKYSK